MGTQISKKSSTSPGGLRSRGCVGRVQHRPPRSRMIPSRAESTDVRPATGDQRIRRGDRGAGSCGGHAPVRVRWSAARLGTHPSTGRARPGWAVVEGAAATHWLPWVAAAPMSCSRPPTCPDGSITRTRSVPPCSRPHRARVIAGSRLTSTVRSTPCGAGSAGSAASPSCCAASATRLAVSLDPRFEPERPQPTPLADAVAALGAAAASVVRRLGARSSLAWQLIVMITGGRLLSPGLGS